jgi:hypothetical protein
MVTKAALSIFMLQCGALCLEEPRRNGATLPVAATVDPLTVRASWVVTTKARSQPSACNKHGANRHCLALRVTPRLQAIKEPSPSGA